jgi:hypothetical protein
MMRSLPMASYCQLGKTIVTACYVYQFRDPTYCTDRRFIPFFEITFGRFAKALVCVLMA